MRNEHTGTNGRRTPKGVRLSVISISATYFVGYKHRGTHKKVRRDSIKRMKRKIKWYVKGKITKEQLQKSVTSWTGHASHADSYNLQKKIITLAARADEQAAAKAA